MIQSTNNNITMVMNNNIQENINIIDGVIYTLNHILTNETTLILWFLSIMILISCGFFISLLNEFKNNVYIFFQQLKFKMS